MQLFREQNLGPTTMPGVEKQRGKQRLKVLWGKEVELGWGGGNRYSLIKEWILFPEMWWAKDVPLSSEEPS